MPGMMGDRGPEGPPGRGAPRWVGVDREEVVGATTFGDAFRVAYIDDAGVMWWLDPGTCGLTAITSARRFFASADCTGDGYVETGASGAIPGADLITVQVLRGEYFVVVGAEEMLAFGSLMQSDGVCETVSGTTNVRRLDRAIEIPTIACAPPLHLER